jgi:glycosyltransferase involved in cell wall biosynthesis
MARAMHKRKAFPMGKKILIICYDYLPLVTPNSFRWSGIAEYWAKQAYEVCVICAWQPEAEREETLKGVRVFRVGGGGSQRIRHGIMGKHRKIVLSRIKQLNRLSVKDRNVLLLKELHDATWKKIYWPDFACLWFFSAIKKAYELVKQHNITNMISVSLPFTDHLVGYGVKKKYQKIAWIADVIDPSFFSDLFLTNNDFLYRGLNKAVERRVFREVQAVTVPTRDIRKRYADLYPEYSQKISVNPNLLHYEKKAKESLFPKDNKIRLVFAGTLHKTTRSPEHLLQVFEMLLQTRIGERLELHLFGAADSCMERFRPRQQIINESIFLHGSISREKAVQAMQSADILVNIGNANPYQEPLKVIEYASAGKPLVNIATISNDSSALVLEKYPASINVFCPIPEGEKTEQLNKLVGFIEHPPCVEAGFLKEWLAPYTIDAVAGAYLSMLNQTGGGA